MDSRLREAYCHHKGEWPWAELPSGVMFYRGLRITVDDFLAYPLPAPPEKGK